MKKVFSILMVALMGLALCVTAACNKDDNSTNNTENNGGGSTGEYVDLGLPSGTKWKNANEVNAADAEYNFYTYDEAVAAFGNALPTREQLDELRSRQLTWTWNGRGYTVTGPNGHSIFLPAAGFRYCSGDVNYVGSDGYYWSSTPNGSADAWYLNFSSGGVGMGYYYRCDGRSVRLVHN